MIYEVSGHRVRVDEFYARRGAVSHNSAILSKFTKYELIELLKEALMSNEYTEAEKRLVDEFARTTVQETLENDYIIS